MDKKSVFLVLVSGALGVAAGAQYPALEATAGIVESKAHVYSGDATAAIVTWIEGIGGPVARALAHLNAQLELSGDNRIQQAAGVCAIRAVHLYCSVDSDQQRVWRWEYKSKPLQWTRVLGEPQ